MNGEWFVVIGDGFQSARDAAVTHLADTQKSARAYLILFRMD